jgi:hypothetical protein
MPKMDDRTPIHILPQRSLPSCSCLWITSDWIKMCQLTTNTHSPGAGGTFRWEGEAKRLPQQGLITIRAKITLLNGVSPPPQFPSVWLLHDPIAPAPLIWRSHLTHSQQPTGIPVLPLCMDITPLSPTSGIQHFHSPMSCAQSQPTWWWLQPICLIQLIFFFPFSTTAIPGSLVHLDLQIIFYFFTELDLSELNYWWQLYLLGCSSVQRKISKKKKIVRHLDNPFRNSCTYFHTFSKEIVDSCEYFFQHEFWIIAVQQFPESFFF